jgi:hypothetical protein
MKHNLQMMLTLGFVAVFLLASCNLSQQTPIFPPTLSPVPLASAISITAQPPVATAPSVVTATFGPTSPTVLTATLAPTAQPVTTAGGSGGGGTRIQFATGSTFYETSGSIQQGNQLSFIVSAGKNQLMMLDVGSRNRDVYLAVTGADGSVLVQSSSQLNTWQGTLPLSEDYRITLTAGGGDSNYDLTVTIPAIIQFAAGATSTLIQGQVFANANTNYMLYALAGQTINVAIKSAKQNVLLTLYGVSDGQPIIRAASGATQYTGILPASQYYMIVAVTPGTDVQFALQITIK